MGSIESKVKSNNIKWCLKNKNKTDKNNHSPLHHAVFRNNKSLVELLVHNSCDLNIIDNYKRTALHIAIESSNLDIVEFLVENNADIFMSDPNPIVYAIELNKILIFKYFLTKINIENHKSLILFAAKFNRIEIIRLLLELGIDINYEQNGITALHVAADKGSFDLVRYLVERGAVTRNTALHYASNDDKKIDIVNFLVNNGASIRLKNNRHHTPILIAKLYNARNIINYYQQRDRPPVIKERHCPKCRQIGTTKKITLEDKMECKICLESFDELILFEKCNHLICCKNCLVKLV
jgi:ankyrin repeat protein